MIKWREVCPCRRDVFICTKEKESCAPKSVYANKKMNSFFHCDIVNYHNKKQRLKRKRSKSTKTVPS